MEGKLKTVKKCLEKHLLNPFVSKAPFPYPLKVCTLQTHHVSSSFEQRGDDRFHVLSTWIARSVFLGHWEQMGQP